uniref:NADH-ubiquinone oxidoreductase chain 2 n=1 Tax=Barnettozyma californica TaxID=36038 RepID=S5U575_9ASCO|nr:NADH dehydrogenase subunit 2 [Barnettozyma californica]AGS44231.1 NADH dehydrogenase subunit 2 [Barnettozyma californica]
MLILSLFILLIYSSVINSVDTLKYNNKYLVRIGIIILLYSIYILKDFTLEILYNNNINDIYIYNNYYFYNKYNIYIILLIKLVVICLLTINSTTNIIKIIPEKTINENNKINSNINGLISKELNINYINIIIFNIIGIILLLSSNNLLSLFISIELQSYSLYILTGIINRSHISAYNSLLYYLIGGLGSIIILYGISILYNTTSIININYINTFIHLIDINNNILLNEINSIYLGWIFIIFGLLIKIGVAPMYNWSILIYSNSNTVITSYISIIPKLSILSYILILINNININIYNNDLYINKLILLLSLFIIISLLIGSIGGLTQIKIKTILAYSGLLNLGYLLLTILITLSSNNDNLIIDDINKSNINSIISYIIYISQYSLNHISIFLLLIISIIYLKNNNNLLNYQHLTYVKELSFIKNNIFLVISLIIIIGSFIGIPPLLGFYGKYTILISTINNNNLFLSLLLIICSVISTIFYLYFLNIVLINNNSLSISLNPLTKSTGPINNNNNNNNIKISNNILTYIFSSIILITLFNFIQWNNILKGAYIISIILN